MANTPYTQNSMAEEHERSAVNLSAVYISLKDRFITFEAEDETATRLTFSAEGILYEVLGPYSLADRAVERLISADETTEADPAKEKERTITVTGRLKTQPRIGRPDSRGNPTAWATLAAHEEGRDGPHVWSLSFHRHTAKIALTLEKDAQVTVHGYPRQSSDPQRMDGLSVFNILNPGKPQPNPE